MYVDISLSKGKCSVVHGPPTADEHDQDDESPESINPAKSTMTF
jgi:hypothetical protein